MLRYVILPETITESDPSGLLATVTFEYDTRRRLVHETRTAQNPYDLTYVYDQGGNRMQKIDAVNNRLIEYYYDVGRAGTHGTYDSANNRLEYYETWDTTGQPSPLVSTTWYDYNANGTDDVCPGG